MKTIEYTTRDKKDWPRGEWDNEPDKKQWADEATGLPCIIRRSNQGDLCGYVGVSETHPLFEQHYRECYGIEQPHGGLTFSDHCDVDGPENDAICHIPGEGESDNVWWFGFDTGHHGDYMPYMMNGRYHDVYMEIADGGTYKNLEYVEAECKQLAATLSAI